MKTDLHSHILPGIDDGARDQRETAKALMAFATSGVFHLALTPHYYPSQTSLDTFLSRRERAYQKLLSLPEAKGFSFSLGAEVYFTDALFNNEDLISLCYRGTRCMLTELETKERFSSAMERNLLRLTEDYGITPILAHIDRYPFLVKDLALLKQLRAMGCLFQVNLEGFLHWWLRPRLFRVAKLGYIDFLGQDVHLLPLSKEKQRTVFSVISKKDKTLISRCDEAALSCIFAE